MNRTVILLLLWLVAAFIPAYAETSSITLASWNIRIFSDNSRSDEELREIAKVAKKYDFIAIVELRDEVVLQRLVKMLRKEFGREYAYDLSPYVGNVTREAEEFYFDLLSEEERGSKELYAFLYDKHKIKCTKQGELVQDKAFFRQPYYASFQAGNFDFTVLVTHVIWGKSVSQRRKEIQQLARIYQNLQQSNPDEQDLLLVGDFNRNPDDELAWGLMKSITGMHHLFKLPDKSMIVDSNLYDNIWFQSNFTQEFTLDQGIDHFDETQFGNDDDKASLAVSDHRPVWGKFRVNGHDDD